jgi:hypothetical protein
LGLLQTRLAHFGLVAGLALLALGNVHHAADRKHGNDENTVTKRMPFFNVNGPA